MASKDELAKRRFQNLVRRVDALMRASLKPEYGGYYGQLVLGVEAVEELGDPKEIRRAAHTAGRALGWKVVTNYVGGRLFILDDREPPEDIRELVRSARSSASGPP